MSMEMFHNLPDLARKGGFALCDGSEERDEAIDWRFIASIDPSRIIRDSNFEKLDESIPFLIKSSIGNLLNVRILDPAIARIYTISQLSLQYLVFCTKFLDKSVYSLRENIFNYQQKIVRLEDIIAKREEEVHQLQKKLKRQETLNQPIFPCTKCTKNFLSAALLENHMQRKHPVQESKDKDSNLINTIKLELEIKTLKEKLNATEKELMDVTRKPPMECEKCSENNKKRFQNVAVQSNFEEKEKDDVEKDAICELLENQMKNFEEWKSKEEARYRSEIVELRARLDETIEMLKQNAKEAQPPPSPAPRTLTLAEKCIGTSKSVESLPPQPLSEENIWKNRYQELEKMYEDHQQKMALTVSSIESMYNEKMSKIEESVKNLSKKPVEPVARPKIPLAPKIVTKIIQESSSESSSESEDLDEIKPATTAPVIAKPPEIAKIPLETFSAQKFNIRPQKNKKPSPSKSKLQQNPREVAEKMFKQRLKSLGISHSMETLNKSEFSRVHSDMVTKRDETKSKHKSFFLTRKKLKSQVDKIFHGKSKQEPRKKVKMVESEVEEMPTVIESKVSAVKESKDPVVKESRIPVPITVKSDVEQKIPTEAFKAKSPSEATPQVGERNFRDDLERVLAKRLQESAEPGTSEDPQPGFAKNKKVLFNLDHLNDVKKFDEIREINEDDSDFDISSFSNE